MGFYGGICLLGGRGIWLSLGVGIGACVNFFWNWFIEVLQNGG